MKTLQALDAAAKAYIESMDPANAQLLGLGYLVLLALALGALSAGLGIRAYFWWLEIQAMRKKRGGAA